MGPPPDSRTKASSKYISKFCKKLTRLRESPRPIDSTGSNSRESDNKHTRSEAVSSDWVARSMTGRRAAHAKRELYRWKEGIKHRNAHGGCLGIRRRRRTRQAAKIPDEAQRARDSGDSEWDNPRGATRASRGRTHRPREANPVNRNIQVAGGEDINRDSPSSGERTGRSPNRERSRGCRTAA